MLWQNTETQYDTNNTRLLPAKWLQADKNKDVHSTKQPTLGAVHTIVTLD